MPKYNELIQSLKKSILNNFIYGKKIEYWRQ